jgi:amino acid transporter
MKEGLGRALLITGLTLLLGYVHSRGIRQSSWVINAFTIGKLVPLAVFIVVGMYFVDWRRLAPLPAISPGQAFEAGLLLIFTYGGFDTISVPAGEATNPKRDLPFAFLSTIAVVTVVFTFAQIVAMTTVADATKSTTPMADAALAFMGPLGAVLISVGSLLSMTGNSAGSSLSGSRMLFALGENGELPPFFGRVHPVYRTPANAIWFTSAVALALAFSGSFGLLTAASAFARLVTYVGVSLATLRLRSPKFNDKVQPATFVIPFGAAIPVIAFVISLAMLGGASRLQMLVGSIALAAGAALFFSNDLLRRRRS